MTFLRRLLRRDPQSDSRNDGTTVTDESGVAWEVARSPSGRFSLQYRDASDDGQIGYRQKGTGRWRLMEAGRLRAEGRVERPNDVTVADNGTFVVADWLLTDALMGRFYAFDASGAVLVEEMFGANILHVYLASDGSYAAVSCASNPDSAEFDERFSVYDLQARQRLWYKPLEVGRATGVEFHSQIGVIRVASETFGTTEYRLADGWVDSAALHDKQLTSGNGFTILGAIEEELAAGPIEPARARMLIAACDKASARLAQYTTHAARAHRYAGEILLGLGDDSAALQRWQTALEMDPGVGIKRRAESLARRLERPKATQ